MSKEVRLIRVPENDSVGHRPTYFITSIFRIRPGHRLCAKPSQRLNPGQALSFPERFGSTTLMRAGPRQSRSIAIAVGRLEIQLSSIQGAKSV
jgi:hypothetical protein